MHMNHLRSRKGAAALLLALLVQFAACHPSRPGEATLQPVAGSTDPIWNTFTYAPNAYYQGPHFDVARAESETKCAGLCGQYNRCQYWAWCPTEATSGCDIVTYCGTSGDADTETLQAGSCVLSYDDERSVFSYQAGSFVGWSGGMRNTAKQSPLPSSPSTSPEIPSTSPEIPGESPGPVTPGDCPQHTPPAPITTTEEVNTVQWATSLTTDGSAPTCYDPQADDYQPAPASYGTCRTFDASSVSSTVQDLAQTLCDASLEDAKQAFAEEISKGGQAAKDVVAALLYAASDQGGACYDTSGMYDVMRLPEDFIAGKNYDDRINNRLIHFTNLVQAADETGMGFCVVFYSLDAEDTYLETLATLHTGTDTTSRRLLADNAVTIIGGSPSPSSPALDAPPSSPTPDETGGEAIWGSFTYNANSFFQGPKFISSTQEESEVTCAELCGSYPNCAYWSYCPQSASSGCDVYKYCSSSDDDATPETVPAGTCLLTYDTKQYQYSWQAGDFVQWSGGWRSEGAAPSQSPSPLEPGSSPPMPGRSSNPGRLPGGSPEPGTSPSPGSCPAIEPPTPAVPAANPQDYTFKWLTYVTFDGSSPMCYDLSVRNYTTVSSAYGPCEAPANSFSQAVQDLGQSYCDNSVEELQQTFADAIAAGGSSAEDAMAALVYATQDSGCLSFDKLFKFVPIPPDNFISGDDSPTILENYLQYFAKMLNAGNQVGVGVCMVFYSVDNQNNDEPLEVLATIHTGAGGR